MEEIRSFADWREADAETWHWRWPDFSAFELRCRSSGRLVIAPAFLDRLQALRTGCGFPLPVTSGYRSPEHNARVSGTGAHGPHTTGRAADVAVFGARAVTLVRLALELGFTGLGLRQHGARASRFVHLDDLEPPDFPRPRLWTYGDAA